jgi:hypothetical protein
MTAEIIDLRAWRIAHHARAGLCAVAISAWGWPFRVWLAWWGIR